MNAVTELDREWPQLAQRAFRDALPRWQQQRRALRRFATPRELLRYLHAADPERTDPILLALLTLARKDHLAGRFVLQAILPALKTNAARLLRSGIASYDEVWELLLFYAWQRIRTYPLRRRGQVAANLELDVLQRTRRGLHRAFRLREHAYPALTLELLNLPSRYTQFTEPSLAGDERLLADAIDAGVIGAEDAQLVLDTRIDGVHLRTLAKECSLTYTLLRQRRLRAEDALRAWLRRKEFVAKNGASVLTYGATSRWSPRPRRPRTRPHTRAEQGGRPRHRGVAPTRPQPGRRHA